uniref:Uncharacterized protein n=1 Tax=Globisporangium ultimum (strain ATCC 200006 / CBS 805.95 / DAOM BR144) TaxID=431595 RepID=K3X0Z7_GLOUD
MVALTDKLLTALWLRHLGTIKERYLLHQSLFDTKPTRVRQIGYRLPRLQRIL